MPFSAIELVQRNHHYLAGLRPVKPEDVKAGTEILRFSVKVKDGMCFGGPRELRIYDSPIVRGGFLGLFGPKFVVCQSPRILDGATEYAYIPFDEMLSDVREPRARDWRLHIYLVRDEAFMGGVSCQTKAG